MNADQAASTVQTEITAALTDRAASLRRLAGGRPMTGENHAQGRVRLRNEADLCEKLAALAGAANPQELAEFLVSQAR